MEGRTRLEVWSGVEERHRALPSEANVLKSHVEWRRKRERGIRREPSIWRALEKCPTISLHIYEFAGRQGSSHIAGLYDNLD